jgi:hypothetical protein
VNTGAFEGLAVASGYSRPSRTGATGLRAGRLLLLRRRGGPHVDRSSIDTVTTVASDRLVLNHKSSCYRRDLIRTRRLSSRVLPGLFDQFGVQLDAHTPPRRISLAAAMTDAAVAGQIVDDVVSRSRAPA